MTEEEVDYVVSILQEGKLPLRLDKTPISEEIISPTLGADDDRQRQAGDLGLVRGDHRVHAGLLSLCRLRGLPGAGCSTCCWWWR